MAEISVLLISREPLLARMVEDSLSSLDVRGLFVVRGMGDACTRALDDAWDLVMIDVGGEVDQDELARLVSICQGSDRPLPVLALSETYRVEKALPLFRMGVTDYLSLAEHREHLAGVIRMLCTNGTKAAPVSDEFPVLTPIRRLRVSTSAL